MEYSTDREVYETAWQRLQEKFSDQTAILNYLKTYTVIRRSGLLCLINLVPLMLGGRMNFVLDHCGISLSDFAITHRWLGWLCIAQGIMHVTAGFNFSHA
jgi:hypothetical protein